jgi:hypothetical protein
MIAVLGMTVFDSGELWLQTESGTELYLMAAVYRTRTMQQWTSLSETVRLGSGYDVPGRIVETEHFCWEPHYSAGMYVVCCMVYVLLFYCFIVLLFYCFIVVLLYVICYMLYVICDIYVINHYSSLFIHIYPYSLY